MNWLWKRRPWITVQEQARFGTAQAVMATEQSAAEILELLNGKTDPKRLIENVCRVAPLRRCPGDYIEATRRGRGGIDPETLFVPGISGAGVGSPPSPPSVPPTTGSPS